MDADTEPQNQVNVVILTPPQQLQRHLLAGPP
jgi:hypothetical protein